MQRKNLLSVAVEVEGFDELCAGGCAVEAELADIAYQGEVDGIPSVLLIVGHQFDELGIVVA